MENVYLNFNFFLFFYEIEWIKYSTNFKIFSKNVTDVFDKIVSTANRRYGDGDGASGEINSKSGWRNLGLYTKSQFETILNSKEIKNTDFTFMRNYR